MKTSERAILWESSENGHIEADFRWEVAVEAEELAIGGQRKELEGQMNHSAP